MPDQPLPEHGNASRFHDKRFTWRKPWKRANAPDLPWAQRVWSLSIFGNETSSRRLRISRFFETVFIQRALSSLLVDFTNVLVGGLIGMTLLVFYHPSFMIFDLVLVASVALSGF